MDENEMISNTKQALDALVEELYFEIGSHDLATITEADLADLKAKAALVEGALWDFWTVMSDRYDLTTDGLNAAMNEWAGMTD